MDFQNLKVSIAMTRSNIWQICKTVYIDARIYFRFIFCGAAIFLLWSIIKSLIQNTLFWTHNEKLDAAISETLLSVCRIIEGISYLILIFGGILALLKICFCAIEYVLYNEKNLKGIADFRLSKNGVFIKVKANQSNKADIYFEEWKGFEYFCSYNRLKVSLQNEVLIIKGFPKLNIKTTEKHTIIKWSMLEKAMRTHHQLVIVFLEEDKQVAEQIAQAINKDSER